jgi:thiol:disulfide interchange protein DsbD
MIATATMQKTWVLYSQFTDDNGPIPTSFIVNDAEVKFEEKSKALKEYDDMIEVEVIKFKDKAVFTKKFPIKKGESISGYVTYMTCDGEKCLPPTDVAFDLKY